MRTKQFNAEVIFAEDPLVAVGSSDIDSLIKQARQNERGRMRLCAHNDVDSSLHEMFIVHQKGAYVRPHKHLRKVESFHVIEGSVDVVIFGAEGDITRVVSIGDYSSGKAFYHRLSDPSYHTLLIRSDLLVFHEVTNGPFRNSDTEFPAWAPEEADGAAVAAFMTQLDKDARKFLAGEN